MLSKETCKAVFCQRFPTRRGYYLQPVESAPPSQACYVCSSQQQTLEVSGWEDHCMSTLYAPYRSPSLTSFATFSWKIDTAAWTLGDLVKRVIKGKLGLVEPSVMLGSSVIYEEGDDMDDSLLMHMDTPLEACPAGGIHDSTLVTVEDFVQDLKVRVPCVTICL